MAIHSTTLALSSAPGLLVGLEHADFSQAQPLRGKGIREALRTRIGQETCDLLVWV
jgi:hypothetical protein